MPTGPRSNAVAFFEYIQAQPDPFAYLSSLPDGTATHYPFFEEEWIDFKGQPNDDKDGKKIWSKAISAFANMNDGLIVWGIDARKLPPRDIDAASGLRLIPDPSAFESRLRDWVRDATNPPAIGIDYRSYPGPDGQGFVVCYVPESTHKPHRAEWADRRYYYRAGDDFHEAGPAMLRILFNPQVFPQLKLLVTLSYDYEGEFSSVMMFLDGQVELQNTGGVTAKNPLVGLNWQLPVHYLNTSRSRPELRTSWDRSASPAYPQVFVYRGDIHPRFSVTMLGLSRVRASAERRGASRAWAASTFLGSSRSKWEFAIFAENYPPKVAKAV